MIFHYCKAGETVLSIAREYGVSPIRLIEENALNDPERLAVGQCVAIYSSKRSYTVRGGDTFENIARRFLVSERELMKWNPGIGQRKLLYPGQILSLGRVEQSFGTLCVNGIVHSSTSLAKLSCFASALTYLTINVCFSDLESDRTSLKIKDLTDFCHLNAIVPLLNLTKIEQPNELCEKLSSFGFGGVFIDFKVPSEALDSFCLALKEEGMISIIGKQHSNDDQFGDWIHFPFADHSCLAEKRFGEILDETEDPYRTMIELPHFAIERSVAGKTVLRTLPACDCDRIAYRKNASISHLDNGKAAFSFLTAASGKHDLHEILYDDLEAIKNGLTLLGESGIAGISIYPEWSLKGLTNLLHRYFDVIKAEDGKNGVHFSR